MDGNGGEKEAIKKPGYDARQRYYDVVMDHFRRASVYASLGQFRLWYVELHSAYTMLAPWMKSQDKEDIKKSLLKIRGNVGKGDQLRNSRQQWARLAASNESMRVEEDLLELQEAIIEAARHMMLPESTITEEAWDAERFLRESGA